MVKGEILFKGRDLLKLTREELRNIRGRDIAMIFQDPLSSLNPVLRVGYQIDEAMYAHDKIARERGGAARDRPAEAGARLRRRSGASRTIRISSVAACASAR